MSNPKRVQRVNEKGNRVYASNYLSPATTIVKEHYFEENPNEEEIPIGLLYEVEMEDGTFYFVNTSTDYERIEPFFT